MSTNLSVTLTTGAVRLLNQLLEQPGWATTATMSYRAAALADRLQNIVPDNSIPQTANPPSVTPAEAATIRAWAATPKTLELPIRDMEVCRACVKHFTEKGQLQNTLHLVKLMDALDMAPKD